MVTEPGLAGTRAALESGAITAGHAEVIARSLRVLDPVIQREAEVTTPDPEAAQHRRRELSGEVETLLLDRAVAGDVSQTQRAAVYLQNTLDPDGSRRRRRMDEAERFLETSVTSTGGLKLRGYLTGGQAASLQAALDAFSAPTPADDGTRDPRTPVQRRADALGAVAREVLRAGTGPAAGGVRPQVQVLVPLPALEEVAQDDDVDEARAGSMAAPGKPGGVTAFGQVLDPETVRQFACDAALTRIVVPAGRPDGPLGERGALVRMLSAPSRPLDVGRAERSVTAPIRTALVARDRHCAFPGCDRPHPWCDAHHVRHWADGGTTALDNLVLLCGQHHSAIHHAGWTVRIDRGSGLPIFSPPWNDRHAPRGALPASPRQDDPAQPVSALRGMSSPGGDKGRLVDDVRPHEVGRVE